MPVLLLDAVDIKETDADEDEDEISSARGNSHQRGCDGGLPQIDEEGLPL